MFHGGWRDGEKLRGRGRGQIKAKWEQMSNNRTSFCLDRPGHFAILFLLIGCFRLTLSWEGRKRRRKKNGFNVQQQLEIPIG